MNDDLKQLILTGALPSLTLGMTREEVYRAAGKPHDVSTAGRSGAENIWKYDLVELHFNSERIARFYADHLAEPLGRNEIETELGKHEVGFRVQPQSNDTDTELIVTSVNSAVLFDSSGKVLAVWAPVN